MELSGLTWHVPPFVFNNLRPLSVSGQTDWHAFGFQPGHQGEATLFGLLCVRHKRHILCQHTFWHARWDSKSVQDA